MTTAILTLNMTGAPKHFGLTSIKDELNKGNAVVLHSKGKCTLIFHRCITIKEGKQKTTLGLVSKTITVTYKNVKESSDLLREDGWLDRLESGNCFECLCPIDEIIRKVWWDPKSLRLQ